MPIEGQATPSLRDTISAAVDTVEQAAPVAAPPETPVAATPGTSAPPADVLPSQGAVSTPDGRTRNPDGTFAPKVGQPAQAPAVQPAPSAPAVEASEPLKMPSSWKGEHAQMWATLPRSAQEEIHRREGDQIKGISSYKQAFEGVKPVLDALEQHRDILAASNMHPAQFIGQLAGVHKALSTGAPQDKLRAFAKFAQDYQVPLNELLIQGDDGKVYLNQQYFNQQQQQPAQPQALTPQQVDERIAVHQAKQQLNGLINQFIEAKDASGNPLHPHYEAVWTTMDGLLRAGVAKDLPTAYKLSLSAPQFSHLAPAQQPAPASVSNSAEVAARARANAISPQNQAPTELVVDAKAGNGLRAVLEAAANAHLGGGRV